MEKKCKEKGGAQLGESTLKPLDLIFLSSLGLKLTHIMIVLTWSSWLSNIKAIQTISEKKWFGFLKNQNDIYFFLLR